jgi:hypothetical protein
MPSDGSARDGVYTRYPASSILTYNGLTVAHYVLGGIGIMLGYDALIGYVLGALYLVFAFGEMYVLMPLKVCPNCVYYKLEGSLCVSGMNVVSRRIASEGDVKRFADRASGLLCPNNLYIAALVVPILALVPALILDFAAPVLAILLVLVALLLLRFFVVFPRVACVHCRAKNICPNAQAMGLGASGRSD